MDYIAGIDEAGRGPVIGPLVICCAFCNRKDEKKLNLLCKKDSKKLTAKRRKEILKELADFCSFRFADIDAGNLNIYMSEMSLNDIEARAMAKLMKQLKNCDIMIDMPDRYSWTFRSRMERFGAKRFEAEHKADENYPIVAAASIAAKVRRDGMVDEIKKTTGIDFGSGYPSDRKTRDALKKRENLRILKKYIREHWETLETIKQRKLFED